jgi:hypothetical protein
VLPVSKLYAMASNPTPASLAVTVNVTLQLVGVVGLWLIALIVGGVVSILVTEIPVVTVPHSVLGKVTVSVVLML